MSSVEQTRELNDFNVWLESKKSDCDRHLRAMEVQKEKINRTLEEEFEQLRPLIDGLGKKLKNSVKKEFNKKKKNVQRQKDRVSVHQELISRVLERPPDAAFFDMTDTLEAIVNRLKKDISELNVSVQMTFQESNEDLNRAIESLRTRRIPDANVRCLVCGDTDTDQGTDQSGDQRVNSSPTPSASKRKILYPKIHFCGNVIWICSTCIIKGKQCNHCHEDLLDPQVDEKENLRHTQLFTDLTMAEDRDIISRNENCLCMICKRFTAVSFCPQCECIFLCQACSEKHCKMETENKTKYHIVKHIERIKECTRGKKSSPCVLHTDKNSDFFCCNHNVPVCFCCRYIYHARCKVNKFPESLEETKRKLSDFNEKLELKKTECDGHLQTMEVQKEEIDKTLIKEFEQLHLWIAGEELKNELNTQYKSIQRQTNRISMHQELISQALHSPLDRELYDMKRELEAMYNSIEKDISQLNDVSVQMKRNEDLGKAIKSLEAMRFVSGGSSQGNVMETNSCNKTDCTLYSRACSVSGPRGSININEPGMTHETKNVVYVYTCTKCHMLYVGETKGMLEDRDRQHHEREKDSVFEHERKHRKEEKDTSEKGKLKHFNVSCVKKDLVDEDERFVMETLIMLKLGTLQPDGLNKEVSRKIHISLEILRYQALEEADMEILHDIINGRDGFNSFSCNVLNFDNLYEVLLEEINDNNIIIIITSQNPGENTDEPEKVQMELPTGTLACRLGFACYGQYGYVYVNGFRCYSTQLQDNFRSKICRVVFSACSKITGLPIQPQKTWKFARYACLKLSDKGKTAECRSLGCITSAKSMKLNILYEIFVDELYGDENRVSVLGISINPPLIAPEFVFMINLTKGSRCGVIVDAQGNMRLFLNREYLRIVKKCETLPCYFLLQCTGLKVSTFPETRVFFDQKGNVIA